MSGAEDMPSTIAAALPPIEAWIDRDDLRSVPTATYWNDVEIERLKVFGNPERLSEYLKETSLEATLHDAVRLAQRGGWECSGTGIDLAAGACWTTAILSRLPAVHRIYAVDISAHRLGELAPRICAHFGAVPAKVRRVIGSFYDIRLPDRSVDFCVMSQGFHHADDPERLVSEMKRVLRPGAPVLLTGETPVYPLALFIARLKNIAKFILPSSLYTAPPVEGLWPSFEALYPPDAIGGDRAYRIREYERLFATGFTLRRRRSRRYTTFVAVRNSV